MYAAEVFGIFAVHGGDASFSISAITNNCFRNATFTTRNTVVRFAKSSTLCRCSVDSKSVGDDVFSVTPSNKSDVDYLGESTKGDLNVKLEHLQAFGLTSKLSEFQFY